MLTIPTIINGDDDDDDNDCHNIFMMDDDNDNDDYNSDDDCDNDDDCDDDTMTMVHEVTSGLTSSSLLQSHLGEQVHHKWMHQGLQERISFPEQF